jgi:hypothetical protein
VDAFELIGVSGNMKIQNLIGEGSIRAVFGDLNFGITKLVTDICGHFRPDITVGADFVRVDIHVKKITLETTFVGLTGIRGDPHDYESVVRSIQDQLAS